MQKPFAFSRRAESLAGFTLIELIMVLMLIGVLAAVALPRFGERRAFEVRGFADQLAATVGYAQKAAIAQRRRVRVEITAGAVEFAVCTVPAGADACAANMDGCATALILPTGGSRLEAPDGVALTPHVFRFDCQGRPVTDVNAGWGGVADTAIAVTAAGEPVQTVLIGAESGYARRPPLNNKEKR